MVNTLTLNPAIDNILYLDKVEKNVTSRIKSMTKTIGGKGTHVSINLKLLGIDNRAYGIAHGETGKKIVKNLESYGIDVKFVEKDHSESRTNFLLVEKTHDCTVIAEKGVTLTDSDIEDICNKMRETISDGDFLIFSGDASNCADPAVYTKILNKLSDKHLKVFLDTSGETLKRCISSKPYLIKPNLDELSTLCGREVTSNDDDVINAINSLDKYGIEIIAVSLGKKGSIIKSPQGIFKAVPPDVEVFNTVGCGDSFLASLIYGICKNLPIDESLKIATAVSSATAESALSVGFDEKEAKRLIDKTEIIKL